MSADVERNHLLPVRPVVRPAIPDAERVANALAPQDSGELPVVLTHRVVLTDREDDVLTPKRREAPRVVLVLHEVERVAGVDGVVRVTAREPLDVVVAAHPDDAVHALRVPEAEARRVVRTEARAGR